MKFIDPPKFTVAAAGKENKTYDQGRKSMKTKVMN
jgi:hypothetical protein